MANVEYVAKDRGEVASGHSAGTTYNFDFDISDAVESSNTTKNQKRALDGTSISVLYRHDYIHAVTTTIITKGTTDWDYWREFLSSVRNGETFELDIDGTNASPDAPLTMILDGDPSYNRVQINLYRISFTAIHNETF